MSTTIPDAYRDLIDGPVVATLATSFANGQPHTTAVWCSYDGDLISIVTSRGLQKEKNMRANPLVSLMLIDPQNPYRYLEVRGTTVEIAEAGAIEKLNEHTRIYTGKPTYYGHIVPAEDEGSRTHVICKIRPDKVITNG